MNGGGSCGPAPVVVMGTGGTEPKGLRDKGPEGLPPSGPQRLTTGTHQEVRAATRTLGRFRCLCTGALGR
jgi:hypothetical protein